MSHSLSQFLEARGTICASQCKMVHQGLEPRKSYISKLRMRIYALKTESWDSAAICYYLCISIALYTTTVLVTKALHKVNN